VVGTYHEVRLAELVQREGVAVDGLCGGDIDAFEVDEVIFQYSRAARELWNSTTWATSRSLHGGSVTAHPSMGGSGCAQTLVRGMGLKLTPRAH